MPSAVRLHAVHGVSHGRRLLTRSLLFLLLLVGAVSVGVGGVGTVGVSVGVSRPSLSAKSKRLAALFQGPLLLFLLLLQRRQSRQESHTGHTARIGHTAHTGYTGDRSKSWRRGLRSKSWAQQGGGSRLGFCVCTAKSCCFTRASSTRHQARGM